MSDDERRKVLQDFRLQADKNTIFCSTVADAAIDLPEANVVIQVGLLDSEKEKIIPFNDFGDWNELGIFPYNQHRLLPTTDLAVKKHSEWVRNYIIDFF